MFTDQMFDCGHEFMSDFCSNIYSKIYLPDSEVIGFGDNFSELILIQ